MTSIGKLQTGVDRDSHVKPMVDRRRENADIGFRAREITVSTRRYLRWLGRSRPAKAE